MTLWLSAGFWFCLSAAVLAGPRIVLDAAHGGEDSGVKAGGQTEKGWNLKFAQALSEALEAAGFTPVLVRRKDENLPQEKRDEAINTAQASAVLVLHAEREWSGTQKGPLLVVQPPNRSEAGGEIPRWGFVSPMEFRASLRLARALAQGLGFGPELSSLSDSRGSAGETASEEGRILCLPHSSLRNLTPPSVVLIPLFLSSENDREGLSDEAGQAVFIEKVVRGLKGYFQMDSPATPTPGSGEATPAAPPAMEAQ